MSSPSCLYCARPLPTDKAPRMQRRVSGKITGRPKKYCDVACYHRAKSRDERHFMSTPTLIAVPRCSVCGGPPGECGDGTRERLCSTCWQARKLREVSRVA